MLIRIINSDKLYNKYSVDLSHGISCKYAQDLGLKHTRIAKDTYEVIDRNLFMVSVLKYEIEFIPYKSIKHIRVVEWNNYNDSDEKLGLQLGPFPFHYYVADEKRFMLGMLEHGIEFEEIEDLM